MEEMRSMWVVLGAEAASCLRCGGYGEERWIKVVGTDPTPEEVSER